MQGTIEILGYRALEPIHEGVNTVLYRAIANDTQQPVILKVLRAEHPTLEQITRLKHEHQVIANLDLPGVVRVHRLETHGHRAVLVLEDFGGRSLKQCLSERQSKILDIRLVLSISIQLAKALTSLQRARIIHKDIKPSNIIFNEATGEVKLTDFSIATRLTEEMTFPQELNQLEGTLVYMSPEQTGRMNRTLDYRSDFYSLGVTLYELLSGRLPFRGTDPLELVHCHIAKAPPPLQILNPNLPEAIAAIVHKLMSKNAEDRYQSAAGLLADLERCQDALAHGNTIPDFTPGERDRSAQLLIPKTLYGREAEVATLLAAFDRVAQNTSPLLAMSGDVAAGTTELMLISGYSGIGKSSLVNEIHKPIVRQRGYFIGGKFDQYKRNVPYASLIQAFQSLTQQVLTENSDRLQSWREKLLAAIGPNGQVIIDVIPQMELILGAQPAVPELGASESQNRFLQVFQAVVGVFAQPAHPLVLFLDDLQWADSASLKLIQALLSNPDSRHLLMIGAYRDNEVSPVHPLMKTVEDVRQSGRVVNQIVLQPLQLEAVQRLIQDALSGKRLQLRDKSAPEHLQAYLHSLADLLYVKTQGNPFFLTQLLKTLHQEQLLTFDFGTNSWQWDVQAIQETGIADQSVVELVAGNLVKLPPETQEILKLAACVGDRFTLPTLVVISGLSLSALAQALQPALEERFILPLSQDYKIPLLFSETELSSLLTETSQTGTQPPFTYRFLHDRVQQAAYSLIPEGDRPATHLRIGRLLLHKIPAAERSTGQFEGLFEIVNALNCGVELIDNPEQRVELARLNLAAGRKAKAAAAYETADSFLQQGRSLLPDDAWAMHYDLTLSLYAEAAQSAYLVTHYDEAEAIANTLEQNAASTLDAVQSYELKIQIYIAQLQMWRSLTVAFDALSLLGFAIASPLHQDHLQISLPALESLDAVPPLTDPMKLAALRILNAVTGTAYQTQPEVFRWVAVTQLKLCVKYGHSPLAAPSYATYAWYCSTIQAADRAYEAGQIAMKLLEQYHCREWQCSVVQLFECFVRHQKEHIRNTFTPLVDGIHVGLETGDLGYVSYSVMNYCDHVFFSGEPLESHYQNQMHYGALLLQLKQHFQLSAARMWQQVTLNLLGRSANPSLLVGEVYDETEVLPRLEASQNYQALFVFHLAKLMLHYWFGEFEAAIAYAKQGEQYAGCGAGLMATPVYWFYYGLALLAAYPTGSAAQQSAWMPQILTCQVTVQRWAESAPMNHQHKADLLAAELAQIQGDRQTAMDCYDRAIAQAVEQGFIQEAAIASERAAQFYESLEKQRIAQNYLIDAYYSYIQWGAIAKVHALATQYPMLLNQTDAASPPTADATITATATRSTRSTSSQGDSLDLTTAMKAAEAIASELHLDALLSRILSIILENAGAQKGCLVLDKEGQLHIEAIDHDPDQDAVVLQSVPLESSREVPISLIHLVWRTQQPLVLSDAASDVRFEGDRYLQRHQPKSVLCAPILYQGKRVGIVYLENPLTANAFSPARLELLKLLTSQAAIALENARLYAREQDKSRCLQDSLQKLQHTQAQLVQTEKISQLGQLVAGVAHEVNNPVSFIAGNLTHASRYIEDLVKHLALYQHHYAPPATAIQDHAEEIDLEFLLEDLPKMVNSMKLGTDRIRDIMQSLRTYSRADGSEKRPTDLHAGLDTTLLILSHRLKAKPERPAIRVVKNYGSLPPIDCYSGQINQVFMNLIANAIDAMEDGNVGKSLAELEQHPNTITISSEATYNAVTIRIADNGPGMSEAVRQRLFDAFFTTKPEGKGTGLGLSISYQIVTENHGGTLDCVSSPGQGAEFVVQLPIQPEIPALIPVVLA
ncbi:MAG: AAA family ATPase [Cyanobacteria bacterium J069]|nr:MAG: GAF domain-containing protein [Cyanobacteria bacterium J069]